MAFKNRKDSIIVDPASNKSYQAQSASLNVVFEKIGEKEIDATSLLKNIRSKGIVDQRLEIKDKLKKKD